MIINELLGKKIAILGFWLEWKSTLKFLKKIWVEDITILDKKDNNDFTDSSVKAIFWGKYLESLTDFDFVFKSPWISPYNVSELNSVKDKLITQAEIFSSNYNWKIIWITWTKWKSTTSTLAYEALKALWYNVKLVWNIWNPVLEEIDILSNVVYDFVVYELSSYMLEWYKPKLFIWLLNNIYDCHLDWHEWRENYSNAKFNVFANSENKLVNYELKDNTTLNNSNNINVEEIYFFWLDWKYSFKNSKFHINEDEVLIDENIALNWEHNRKNISGVLWILDIINPNFDKKIFKEVLLKFTWLAHRQENIWTYNGLTFINDSIASTPESAIAAIKTFQEKIWTVFIWNEDSGFNLEELKNTIIKFNIKNIVLFPVTWEKLFWEFSRNMNFDVVTKYIEWEFETKLYKTLSMEKAVDFACKNSKSWEFVLLSTWAPSFNAKWSWLMPWKSYVEKWDMFKNAVIKYSK